MNVAARAEAEMSVKIERNGPVTTVILAREEARNAVNPKTAQELYDAFLAFDADPAQHAAVLWGAGGAFCAGYDLKAARSRARGARLPRTIFLRATAWCRPDPWARRGSNSRSR